MSNKRKNHYDNHGYSRDKKSRFSNDRCIDPQSLSSLSTVFSNLEFRESPSDNFFELTKSIWEKFKVGTQTDSEFRRKIEVWTRLERVLSNQFGCATHVFGSTLNGYGTRGSDMDICMYTQDEVYDKVSFLAKVRRMLKQKCSDFLDRDIELIPAKVPILKMYDKVGNMEIDLSISNENAVRNTHLLFCYSQLDWRVRPLVVVIKQWAKNAGINDAKYSTMSSYTLTIMAILYLQCGTTPPVLPSLQQNFHNVFNYESDIFKLPFLSRLPQFRSLNNQSLGQLLHGFFRYYDLFDFTLNYGSVRTGRVSSIDDHIRRRANGSNIGQWRAYICMEEPFDCSNVGRAIIKRPQFDKILNAFNSARRNLENQKCISCLMNSCRIHM